MKKYTKPMIVFESFTLSTNIAGDCDVKTDTKSNHDCWMDFSGVPVFLEGMSGCKNGIQIKNEGGDGEFNGICYDVFTSDKQLFNS